MTKLGSVGRLSDRLTLHLARQIVVGHLKPGTPIPSELELTREFEISKPVVRQAIQALASLGIVRVQHGKRTTVLDENEWNVLAPVVLEAFRLEGRFIELTNDLYDMRLILETTAAAWTAERGTQEQLDRLSALADQMRRITGDSADPQTFLSVDLAFHNLIADAARNLVLRGVMRALHAFLSACWSDSKVVVEHLSTLAHQHARIAAAISARNPDGARATMREHLLWARGIDLGQTSGAAGGTEPM